MLNLKYLFHTPDLAEMLLGNFEYDPASLHLFQYYRISSNAVYPFQSGGERRLLRFAPKGEKRKGNLLAELDFLAYLRAQRYAVMEAVPVARAGAGLLAEAETPWGAYYASVFKHVPGVQLGQLELTGHIARRYGEALGKLHKLSREYRPEAEQRWTHNEVLEWIRDTLQPCLPEPEAMAALEETRLLTEYFAQVPLTPDNYGLIHYDFETDNVFYDSAADGCHVIDFDDAMYHWYALDLEQALDSLSDAVAPELYEERKDHFMEGYRSCFTLPENGPSAEACRRFADLYGYTRIRRASAEAWAHEPEWLTGLRGKLAAARQRKAAGFGKPLG
ncbi:phosphotransferase enzyme family protein [Paenibacillus tepidiphilus]|uniref:phosphotransferase enzyme family protein n=1 Tax=Paenibacillus tepidiphilus TaxID=2608683 RepID=UPI0012387510|nr:phosphotransferase [Paenibacillus tepidiphilus]